MGDVQFEQRGEAGVITLNRPQALNAVTHDMVKAIAGQLDDWEAEPSVTRVVISAVPGRAFSAGGDLRALYDWRQSGDARLVGFYWDEYRLNHRIKTYPKPFVALIDGIVMGGGVGVSIHGSHRVASENTVFAMPEVAIGFYPDIGGTWFLGRCPGRIGEYLGLTGARIKAADLLHAGLATHHVPSDRLPDLAEDLAQGGDVDDALAGHGTDAGSAPLADRQTVIDSVFNAPTVEAVLERFDRHAGGEREVWAARTAELIRANAPLGLKVALRQIRLGRDLDFDACMRLEFQLTQAFMAGHDFFEGVRAIVIDKDKTPRWQPATLEDATDAMVAACFRPRDEVLTFGELRAAEASNESAVS